MKEQWRLLQTKFNNAARNMAIDKAILIANSRGLVPPTVRLYGWDPPAISIGYFQSLQQEVDLDQCKRRGIDYVRRITGGGAVFHEHELTYSIVISEDHHQIPKNILDSYRKICGAIVKALQVLRLESEYVPINDIVVKGKKISGNAQTRKENTVLQHGTVLIDVDVDKMFSLLKVPSEKIKDKLIADVKQRITSLKQILGKEHSFEEISEAMKRGFEKEFSIDLIEDTLLDEEIELSHIFEEESFSSSEWNHKR